MEKPFILHLFTPTDQASPFDVNMAYDAGYDAVVPYTNVALDQVAALTQDAIFSRGPKGAKRTGIFIGGRDNGLAADMLDAARKAMVPPFEVSVFADPSGAFTTAAAMVAAVERALEKSHNTMLEGKAVMIFGGTGPVGAAAAVLKAPGLHNVRNALAASAAAFALAVPVPQIATGLSRFAGVKGRLQKKAAVHGATLIDDTYNANPDSSRAALSTLARWPGSKGF
jgi:methylene-tetrahydromethanopterin dehydrogenase